MWRRPWKWNIWINLWRHLRGNAEVLRFNQEALVKYLMLDNLFRFYQVYCAKKFSSPTHIYMRIYKCNNIRIFYFIMNNLNKEFAKEKILIPGWYTFMFFCLLQWNSYRTINKSHDLLNLIYILIANDKYILFILYFIFIRS